MPNPTMKDNSQNSSKFETSCHLDHWIIVITLRTDIIKEDEMFYPGQIFPLEDDNFGHNQWMLKKEYLAEKFYSKMNTLSIRSQYSRVNLSN